jgi:8-oxo-dGTP pyrophosphatase MutT (NUDIX family)
MDKLIQKIQISLSKELPGKEAQYKMAPSDRAIREQALNLKPIKKSAVLILLFFKDEQLNLLLTQRAKYDGPHSGQISFPGGKFEEAQDKNLLDTAIREVYEEINLSSENFKILGQLTKLIIPISQICVQPYLAFCNDISKAKADGFELTELYKVPLSIFRDNKNIKWKTQKGLEYPYYDFNKKVIWGATAMMISELNELISNL